MFTCKSVEQHLRVCVLTIALSLFLTSSVMPQGGTWETVAPMTTGRMSSSTCQVDGLIYVIGGTDDARIDSLIAVPTVEAYDPGTDTWTKKADMPTPRQGLATCNLNGKIYAIGGQRKNNSPYLDVVEEYDPLTDTWTSKSPLPVARTGLSAAAIGDKIYVMGGSGPNMDPLDTVIAYDPTTNTWEEKSPMRIAITHMGITVYNGKIYVFGGARGFGPLLSIVQVYDPTTDSWTKKSNMPSKRLASSVAVVDGRIYVIGGATTNYPSYSPGDILEIYNPTDDCWTIGANMPMKLAGHSCGVVNGRIYLFGGSTEECDPDFHIVSTVEVFTPPEPEAGTWDMKAPMPTPRITCRACKVDSIIYVIGGSKDPNLQSLQGQSTNEAYDPATDTWTTKAPMPGPRVSFASCVLNEKIYIIGGQRKNFSAYLNIVEEYDPLTDTWAPKAPMPQVRSGVNAIALGNKIYVIGGFGMEPVAQNPLASVIAYDPVTDTWEEKAPMSTAKSAMGVAVHNGKIYVFAGARGFGGFVSIVEEYDPETDTWTQKKDIPTKRCWLSSAVVNGKIYALGGGTVNDPSYTPTSIVEVYDPEIDCWSIVKNMPIARSAHASCAVNGKIYVFGGTSQKGPTFSPVAEVEEYTPTVTEIEDLLRKPNPELFTLLKNYPNPFNPTTTIEYSLKKPGRVTLSIYNIFGRHIKTLVDATQSAGVYSHVWNATDETGNRVSSGVYLYRIEFYDNTGREARHCERKMVLLK